MVAIKKLISFCYLPTIGTLLFLLNEYYIIQIVSYTIIENKQDLLHISNSIVSAI